MADIKLYSLYISIKIQLFFTFFIPKLYKYQTFLELKSILQYFNMRIQTGKYYFSILNLPISIGLGKRIERMIKNGNYR